MGEAVDEALGIAKYYQRTKDRAIATDVPDDLPPVMALRDHMTQVVLNLVLNAVDATSKGGEIRVVGHREDDWVVLAVEDDGRGIDPADRRPGLPALFHDQAAGDRARPVRQPEDRRGAGRPARIRLGAGRGHDLHGPAPGRRRRAGDGGTASCGRGWTHEPSPASSPDSRPPRRGRVLVVDDEEVIASTLQEFLTARASRSPSPPSARGRSGSPQSFEPDLALCDVQLPGLDGLDLLDRLLRVRPETLVHDDHGLRDGRERRRRLPPGAHDYLMKPVIFEELLTKLDRLMGFRRLMLENQALRRAASRRRSTSTRSSARARRCVRSRP